MKDRASIARIEAAVSFAALLVRVVVYMLVVSFASRFPSGQAILTGVLLGDVAATLVKTFVQQRESVAQCTAELTLIGLVYLFSHGQTGWPQDSARQGILALAALGVVATRTGFASTHLGTRDDGFA